ncbi:DUF664 domain-containing protein [Kutzneria buriramensis]|uniref:Uncharacterized protein DUF664 n=1 Tax=Kutzneria buriramensis TaxID=1045776 RepID=A0A3E0H4N5_9PSEU|nr:DUF664 domain-containing protein [Kutzneria buriramensis]REH38178.1 uncharacterized protein DUF664 [Kutzneria buriramensis]
MADLKPPRFALGERETLLALLQYQRDSLVRKVTDLSAGDEQRRLVPSETTLLWLVEHLAWAELLWVSHRFAGRPLPVSAAYADLAEAVAAYRQSWTTVDEIVIAADLDDLCLLTDEAVNLRWVLAHLLQETARHAGHADILRELIDGRTGR